MERADLPKLTHVCALGLAVAAIGLTTVAARAPSAGAATPGPLRVGLVADTRGLLDGGANELAASAVRAASSRTSLGVRIDIRSSPSEASYLPALESMAAQGYDLVIAVGPSEQRAVGQAARAYPDVRFAIVGGSYVAPGIGGLPNVLGLVFKVEQSGYVAGYLAGLVERSSGSHLNAANTIGTISGGGDPAALRTLSGFRAGARAADPAVRLLAGFANAASGAGRCQSLAAGQIAHGADIVYPVAGACGDGALAAAAAAGVWSIGSRLSPDALAPTLLATSVARADRAVLLTLQAVASGTFAGGRDVELGLAQGAVSVTGLSADLSRVIRVRVAAAAARVRAGRVSIPTAPAA
jgi:basic membrane protein A